MLGGWSERQSGVIRCDVWKDMQNIGTVLRHQPLPQGRRVASGVPSLP